MNSNTKRFSKGKGLSGLLLGYSGVNYCGMQRNEGMKTIEEELLTAMFKNSWITNTTNVHIRRADPTDKGVSAARQCISIRLSTKILIKHLISSDVTNIFVFVFP